MVVGKRNKNLLLLLPVLARLRYRVAPDVGDQDPRKRVAADLRSPRVVHRDVAEMTDNELPQDLEDGCDISGSLQMLCQKTPKKKSITRRSSCARFVQGFAEDRS